MGGGGWVGGVAPKGIDDIGLSSSDSVCHRSTRVDTPDIELPLTRSTRN